jgi:hypothetical protein
MSIAMKHVVAITAEKLVVLVAAVELIGPAKPFGDVYVARSGKHVVSFSADPCG